MMNEDGVGSKGGRTGSKEGEERKIVVEGSRKVALSVNWGRFT